MSERKLSLEDVMDALAKTLSPKPFTVEEKLSIVDDFLTLLQRKGLVTSEEILKFEKLLKYRFRRKLDEVS